MNDDKNQTLTLEKAAFWSLMAAAYAEGMVAGQHAASMKDNPEFTFTAAKLFMNGLMDMMSHPVGNVAQ